MKEKKWEKGKNIKYLFIQNRYNALDNLMRAEISRKDESMNSM